MNELTKDLIYYAIYAVISLVPITMFARNVRDFVEDLKKNNQQVENGMSTQKYQKSKMK